MTTVVSEAQRPRNGNYSQPKKPCAKCGAKFFTNVGLDEHVRLGCSNATGSPVTVRRRWWITPAGQAILRERGRKVTALNNSRRVRCTECGRVSTPSGIGSHQRATNHVGKAELRDRVES